MKPKNRYLYIKRKKEILELEFIHKTGNSFSSVFTVFTLWAAYYNFKSSNLFSQC